MFCFFHSSHFVGSDNNLGISLVTLGTLVVTYRFIISEAMKMKIIISPGSERQLIRFRTKGLDFFFN